MPIIEFHRMCVVFLHLRSLSYASLLSGSAEQDIVATIRCTFENSANLAQYTRAYCLTQHGIVRTARGIVRMAWSLIKWSVIVSVLPTGEWQQGVINLLSPAEIKAA